MHDPFAMDLALNIDSAMKALSRQSTLEQYSSELKGEMKKAFAKLTFVAEQLSKEYPDCYEGSWMTLARSAGEGPRVAR